MTEGGQGMLLTMKDIIDLDFMQNSMIRTTPEHLDDRIVEWVSVTEAPVEIVVVSSTIEERVSDVVEVLEEKKLL
jgi:predicted HAD superfamily phosphohydrolase YqeG